MLILTLNDNEERGYWILMNLLDSQHIGDTGWFVFVTLLSFSIQLLLTVGFTHVFGVDIIWWVFCAGWIIATIFTIARYLQGGWREKVS